MEPYEIPYNDDFGESTLRCFVLLDVNGLSQYSESAFRQDLSTSSGDAFSQILSGRKLVAVARVPSNNAHDLYFYTLNGTEWVRTVKFLNVSTTLFNIEGQYVSGNGKLNTNGYTCLNAKEVKYAYPENYSPSSGGGVDGAIILAAVLIVLCFFKVIMNMIMGVRR